ncbi:hypothetical protein P154DRAFT_501582 [Amniculicola lignicola CBS 123094]|uniref:Transcriptional regulatory protein RXT2 N-terminal domain-containing protein n=1 Tax=Amniculicola lignicola CBS 123094 TaxID=1392246 RepID=A0A6A5W339_9PLEO|nr:hypothetical protein P154DRAFT_501582 [Amniculicola lignicola CBS 123094]
MAGQQQQIIDTIFNMKRRLLRPDDWPDEDETELYNGRAQTLKRKAEYARGGQPEHAADPPPYKKRIEHAGYRRYILQRNPPRFDADGDIVEVGDEYEDEDDLSTVEENPYADIHLERTEAGTTSRKEQVALWRVKNLFTKIQGDLSWVPDALLDMDNGKHLYESWGNGVHQRPTNGDVQQAPQAELARESQTHDTSNTAHDVAMEDAEHTNGVSMKTTETDSGPTSNGHAGAGSVAEPATTTNGEAHPTNGASRENNGDAPNGEAHSPTADDASDTASQQTAHRMTTRTRARAEAVSDPSPPSSPSSTANPIHPLFLYPTDSLPDRDFGLPTAEAEDTRMLLQAFVQKQEEISRAATDLYMGMLKGERMRQEVFKWAKAEAHVGEMSDGEDWYDGEEWNLDGELIKGRDEEEDDTVQPGKKSTRQRRKPDKDDR